MIFEGTKVKWIAERRAAMALGGVIGGVLMVAGSLLPWIDGDDLATVLSLSGLEFNEGVLTLLLGLGVAAVGLAVGRGSRPAWLPLLGAIFAFCGLLAVLYAAGTYAAFYKSVGWTLAINGVGMYVAGIGAIWAAITCLAVAASNRHKVTPI